MDVQMQALPFDPSAIEGLSERLLRSHHQHNYGGAVRRLNAIRAELADMRFSSTPGFRINGLKREELIATNSMLLHELYFASIASAAGAAPPMEPAMALALSASFGSVERWREEFSAMGKALGGGSGWVLLVFQPREATLVNQWSADHSQILAGGVPLLALDMYEHAYHIDHGAAAGTYVDIFMALTDWTKVYQRYRAAVRAASEPFAATLDDLADGVALDVRRAGVYDAADSVIPGAVWRDPASVASWSAELPADRKVVVYCVHGYEVSQTAALRLRAAGVDARFLHGGIEAWEAAGRPLQAKPS